MSKSTAPLRRDVVVVAASAGGLLPIQGLLSSLPAGLRVGLALVFHRNPYADGLLLPLLQKYSHFPLVEPIEGQPFELGKAFLAPRDQHLLLSDGNLHLS